MFHYEHNNKLAGAQAAQRGGCRLAWHMRGGWARRQAGCCSDRRVVRTGSTERAAEAGPGLEGALQV